MTIQIYNLYMHQSYHKMMKIDLNFDLGNIDLLDFDPNQDSELVKFLEENERQLQIQNTDKRTDQQCMTFQQINNQNISNPGADPGFDQGGGGPDRDRPKTAILGPQFCRILVLGPHFWWSGGGPGPPGPPLDPPLQTPLIFT